MASGNTMGSGDDDPSLTTSISGAGGMNAGQSLIARIMLATVDVQVAGVVLLRLSFRMEAFYLHPSIVVGWRLSTSTRCARVLQGIHCHGIA